MITKRFEVVKAKQKQPFVLTDNQQCLLMPIGDIHFLAKGFPEKKLRDHIKWGVDRGAYFVGMGDYLDFASETQRATFLPARDSTLEVIDALVKEQVEKLFEILKPSRMRWIGLVEGNHRWQFQNSTTSDQYLASLLNADFLGTSALIRLHSASAPDGHPEADTTIFCHHGVGSAQSAGGNLNKVENLTKIIDADIYLMGHSHAKIGAPIDYQVVSPDGIHYHRTRTIARTGGWLKAYNSTGPQPWDDAAINSRGSYAEEKAYMPTAMGGICIGIGFEKIIGSEYYRPTIHFSV